METLKRQKKEADYHYAQLLIWLRLIGINELTCRYGMQMIDFARKQGRPRSVPEIAESDPHGLFEDSARPGNAHVIMLIRV